MFIIKILATVFGIYFLIRVFGVVFETGLTLATYGIMRFIGFLIRCAVGVGICYLLLQVFQCLW